MDECVLCKHPKHNGRICEVLVNGYREYLCWCRKGVAISPPTGWASNMEMSDG
jgi:hypothetical protein